MAETTFAATQTPWDGGKKSFYKTRSNHERKVVITNNQEGARISVSSGIPISGWN
jgi:hypothetical protein